MKLKPGTIISPDDKSRPIAWWHSYSDRSQRIAKVKVIKREDGNLIYKAVTDKFYDHLRAKGIIFFIDKIPEVGEVLRIKKVKPFIAEVVKI